MLVAEEGNSASTGWLYYANSCFMDKEYERATTAINQCLQRNTSSDLENLRILASIRGRIIGQKLLNQSSGLQRLGATRM